VLSRRNLLFSAGAAVALAGTARAAPASGPEAQLTKAFDDFFNQELDDSPELATSLGLDKGARAWEKSKFQKVSLADIERYHRETAAQLARLRGIDRKPLTGMPAVNYDSVLYDLETSNRGNRRFKYGTGGSPYVLSQITGAWQDAPDFLASQHTIETRADCEAYIARLGEFARVMDEEIERVRHDVALGVVPPDFCIAGALGGMKTLHAPPEQSTLVTSLAERAKAKGIAGDWTGQATKAYQGQVLPALERQMALLESLKAKATHDAGVWRLPAG